MQVDLERHTEQLSGMVESKSIEELYGQYQAIINLTKVAEKLRESLLQAASDWTSPITDDIPKSKSSKLRDSQKRKNKKALKQRKKRRENNDTEEDEKEEDTPFPQPTFTRNTAPTTNTRTERDREEEEKQIQRALEASKLEFEKQVTGNGGEDWELQLAIQASLQQ